MKVTHDVKTISSFLLFLDRVIQEKGEAYTNYSGVLTRTNNSHNGLYAYTAPFKSLVADAGISGASVMTGVYLNGNFVTVGQSGLSHINYNDGAAYFSGQLPASTVVSGRYAFKDFNIQISDQLEMKLLLETKYTSNGRYNQQLSGLPLDVVTAPIVFLKYKSSENLPFSFGGIDDNSIKIRAITICDNEFQKIGISNIFKNLNWSGFRMVNSTQLNYRGDYTGLAYNYHNINFDSAYVPFIKEVKIFDVPWVGEYENMPKNAVLADFEIFAAMRHNT
jgi:hypothetical protein